jgi:hypothetical protein
MDTMNELLLWEQQCFKVHLFIRIVALFLHSVNRECQHSVIRRVSWIDPSNKNEREVINANV